MMFEEEEEDEIWSTLRAYKLARVAPQPSQL